MTTRSIKIIGITLLTATFLTAGCTKEFERLNENPSGFPASRFDPNYLFAAAQLSYTGSRDLGYDVRRVNILGTSCYMQHLATVGATNNFPGDKYMYEESFAEAYWGTPLAGAFVEQVGPITEALMLTKDKPALHNLHQVIRITRAMIMQRLTDIYGDVPYFSAGMGRHSGIYFPKYDRQEEIYNDLLKELEEAIAALNESGGPITGDMIYNGDIEKWKRFGNTLMLRAGMRLTKVNPEKAKQIVEKVRNKTMQSNDDNAVVYHGDEDDRVTANRNWGILTDGAVGPLTRLGKTYIDFLKNNNDPDPRLAVIAQINRGDLIDRNPVNQAGLPNGYELVAGRWHIDRIPGHVPGTGLSNYSQLSNNLLQKKSPTLLLTYAVSELLLADAARRWGIGNAATHYNNGVRAAMKQYVVFSPAAAVSDAAVDAFLATNGYDATKGLEMINTQFWAACLLDGLEAWSNWRRTNYPVLTPVDFPGNATGSTIPRRYTYPRSEGSSNPVNYTAAQQSIPGGDAMTSRVWWDKQ